MRRFKVPITFESTATTPLADALLALRVYEVVAPTQEAAEHYAALITRALERAVDERYPRV